MSLRADGAAVMVASNDAMLASFVMFTGTGAVSVWLLAVGGLGVAADIVGSLPGCLAVARVVTCGVVLPRLEVSE